MATVSKGFLKSTIMYTLAGALPMAAAIILLPFYLTLSTENYGAYALYLAFSVLVQILTTFSFDTGIYVFFHDYKKDPDRLNKYLSSVFGFLIVLGVVAIIFFSLTGDILVKLFLSAKESLTHLQTNPVSEEPQGIHFFPFGFISVITGVFQSLFKVHSNLLQSSENPKMFFWSNLLSFSLIAGFTITGLEVFPQSLWGPVGGRFLAALISGIWVLGRIGLLYGIRFDFKILKESFHFNNSSFIYQLQQWSMNYFDRFIMLFFLPLSDIGVYDFAVKCMLAIEFVISGVYNSFYPKVINIVVNQVEKKSTPEINRYYHGLIALIMVLVCFAILGFSIIMDLGILKSGYEASVKFLPLIGLVYLLRAIRYYFAFPFGALKFSKPLPMIYFVISVVKICLIVVLVSPFGVPGVIEATFVSTIMEIVLLWYFVRKKFDFQFNKFKILGAPLLLGVIIVIFQTFNLLPVYMTYILYIVICFVVLGFLYKNELKVLASGKLIR